MLGFKLIHVSKRGPSDDTGELYFGFGLLTYFYMQTQPAWDARCIQWISVERLRLSPAKLHKIGTVVVNSRMMTGKP